MSSVDKAYETQIKNIQTKTGKSIAELAAIIHSSGLTKHGQIRQMLMDTLGLGYGDASSLIHYVNQSDGERAAKAAGLSSDEVLDGIYTGPKAALRPIHEALMAHIHTFGEFEVAPKKGYVSLRRKRQFAMLGPATNTRFELGLNMKGVPATERLLEQPTGSMCQFKVRLASADEVDAEVLDWLKTAYDASA
jgi:hypothetical protein